MNRAEKRRQQKLAAMAAKKNKSPNPTNPSTGQSINLALQHHAAGRLPEAERVYQQVLQADPNQVDALHLLGVLAHQVGKNDVALELITKAITIKADFAEAHCNLASVLQALGRFDEAATSCRKALKIKPGYGDAHYNLGNALKELGDLEGAEKSYHKALSIKPDHADAHSNLGNVYKDVGKLERAMACYRKSLAIRPDHPETHNNLGNALRGLKKLDEAIASYRKAIAIFPEFAEAHSNLGNIYQDLEKFEDAMDCYGKAISAAQDFAEAHSNLGNVYKFLGRFGDARASYSKAIASDPSYAEPHCGLGNVSKDEDQLSDAAVHYRNAINIRPDYAEAHYNLGTALMELGQLDEAIDHFGKALSIKPDYPDAYNNLGNTFQKLARSDEAIAQYRRAIEVDANFAYAHYNLGFTLLEMGQADEAFDSHRKAITIDPGNGLFWSGYAICLESISFTSYDENQAQELLMMLDQKTIIHKRIAKPVMTLLHAHPEMLRVNELIRSEALGENIERTVEQLSRIPLLLRLMELTTINDANLERILTQIRRCVLEAIISGTTDLKNQSFLAALSVHCFCNGYLFFETEDEKQQIGKLQKKLLKNIDNNCELSLISVAVLSCYRPLHDTGLSGWLLELDIADGFRKVIDCHLTEPLEEKALRDEIVSAGTIKDETSQIVRKQYEENPYPVWIKPVFYPIAKTIRQVLQDIPVNLDQFEGEFPTHPEILIAGCGTGQQLIQTASRFKNPRLVAVDLSLSSLSYALRKTREFQIPNIEYVQCDILDLREIKRDFDLIESRGVLHHLADPLAGWKVLVDMLRPHGLMKISLYSKIARRGIRKSRDLIEEKGYAPTPEGIRDFRKYILDNPSDVDSEIYNIVNSPDFYSTSECRDLVFHAQESQFTALEIETALNDLGLRFLGFELYDSEVLRKFRKINPGRSSMNSLEKWHDFELRNPMIFGELYEFWVQKK